ncbi:hypothetical protein SNOG_09180 [Parastagonospora nodorum SN15]|uniref:Uncharacterized protein n=1 Tax=Phaeosphaeria nodorum (strain SN15 / ATCC MYA-4574 / FGSC 10173) TaxID=321614 RepID=Q0UGD4_PHANO|nr:hypothetical protein SNOG_09180 [Parastagonospora nodorum SN15]EAT83372.1 hypothetical protein SNOG_09180 [Parastagonospora nodorum SN15]
MCLQIVEKFPACGLQTESRINPPSPPADRTSTESRAQHEITSGYVAIISYIRLAHTALLQPAIQRMASLAHPHPSSGPNPIALRLSRWPSPFHCVRARPRTSSTRITIAMPSSQSSSRPHAMTSETQPPSPRTGRLDKHVAKPVIPAKPDRSETAGSAYDDSHRPDFFLLTFCQACIYMAKRQAPFLCFLSPE